jgi:2-dehydropantoate 2-reductase
MGAGAVGCYIGGALAAHGDEVILVGRERTKRDVEQHGLSVVDLDGSTRRPAVTFETDIARLADCDVVLVCVKSGGTKEAAERLATVLRPDVVVVSFQNGVTNPAELRKILGQRVLAGIVNFNVLAKGAGTFRRATSGALILEQASEPLAAKLVTSLRAAAFDVEVRADIVGVQWSKLVINSNNSVSALSDRPTREIVLSSGYRRVLSALMGEALAVLRAANIRPARVGPLPITAIPRLLRLPTPLFRVIARAQLKIDPEARSSMWEDLTGGRPTEVDYLNGQVVALAKTCGAQAPINERIVAIVHEAERAGKGSPKLSAEELWLRMTRAG